MVAFSTLDKNRLPSLIFSSSGRDKSEGAGCGSPFSAAGWSRGTPATERSTARSIYHGAGILEELVTAFLQACDTFQNEVRACKPERSGSPARPKHPDQPWGFRGHSSCSISAWRLLNQTSAYEKNRSSDRALGFGRLSPMRQAAW